MTTFDFAFKRGDRRPKSTAGVSSLISNSLLYDPDSFRDWTVSTFNFFSVLCFHYFTRFVSVPQVFLATLNSFMLKMIIAKMYICHVILICFLSVSVGNFKWNVHSLSFDLKLLETKIWFVIQLRALYSRTECRCSEVLLKLCNECIAER